jgi:hypothetical protein
VNEDEPVAARCVCKHRKTSHALDRNRKRRECLVWMPGEGNPTSDYCPCTEFRPAKVVTS